MNNNPEPTFGAFFCPSPRKGCGRRSEAVALFLKRPYFHQQAFSRPVHSRRQKSSLVNRERSSTDRVSMTYKNVLLVFSIVLLQSFAIGRQYRPRDHFTFNADFARFRYDSTSSYVEIYYGFYPRLLSYDKMDSVYAAKVVVSALIRKNGSDSTVLNQRLLVPIVVEDTTLRALNSTFVFTDVVRRPFRGLHTQNYRLRFAATGQPRFSELSSSPATHPYLDLNK